ncbi:hypothetical protein GCM10022295_53320 [Streptomyces osmaniensis]|uniref:Uncharacterized protein n=1 Tax=Streptomyces osmaniensis TaxID=593134 RepID=A0ABP6XDE6_9ACTN
MLCAVNSRTRGAGISGTSAVTDAASVLSSGVFDMFDMGDIPRFLRKLQWVSTSFGLAK